MAWTKEQQQAIDEDGTNIIVSAGAGSGKTAVLSERVLKKVASGIHIDELLIMTFTNAAAKEMKDRIRKKLTDANLLEEVNLIDSAYITTFDSFSLSIVKKYHYILNIPKNINISEQSLLTILKNEVMDMVFDDYYENSNDKFKDFISCFCLKDDNDLKQLLIKLNDNLDMKLDRDNYLKTYFDTYYNEEKINHDINIFVNELKIVIEEIESNLELLTNYLDSDYIEKLSNVLSPLIYSKNYNEIVNNIPNRLPNLPKGIEDEEVKAIKQKISDSLSTIKNLLIYQDDKEIKREFVATKDNVEMIIEILNRFNDKYQEEKEKRNLNTFMDISRLAIKLVSEHQEIRNELKYKFKEIMLDEYQDTNDIQEYFVSLISNHNVYMVGDIKQSIYRFRNANPYIFKNKYDRYSNKDDGIKIDLLKNFRSRSEVLENINLVFNELMDDTLGGADYKKTHQMVFGNLSYNKDGKTKQDYDFEILSYLDDKAFRKNEKEIFIIGEDIKRKIDNHYIIFEKDSKIKREVTYNDFVILLDRSSDFDLYKQIFEYLGIPLTLYKDEELKSDYDIMIIKNILKLVKNIGRKYFEDEFKYAFLSVGRSFLFDLSDDILFDYFYRNNFKESEIYIKCEQLYKYYYELSPKGFFLKLLEIFNVEECLLTIGNIEVGRVRLEYFYNLISSLQDNGKTIDDFIDYLDNIFDGDEKTTFSLNNDSSNSVKIMTIHKSKGLEYPICYFAGFTKSFSFKELNDDILFSNNYGIIIPYFNYYSKDTFYKTLIKLETKKEEVSEKIRLLYVAMTRAKEKMIIVIPKIEEDKVPARITYLEKRNIKSFYEMITAVYYRIKDYIRDVEAKYTKDYLINKDNISLDFLKDRDRLEVVNFAIESDEIKEERFSKVNTSIITKEEDQKLEFGVKIHGILEYIDFKNPDYSNIDSFIKKKIKSFIDSDIIRENISSKFYKEYEFFDNNFGHGIIDLMIENNEKVLIIDYKLKNINDEDYKMQLNGYKEYISTITDKEIELYLYSIMDEKFCRVS